MKILDIAKECFQEMDGFYRSIDDSSVYTAYFTEAQLTATIEAWNKQNSEPIYQVEVSGNWIESIKSEYDNVINNKRIVYLAPPQPTASQELKAVVNLNKTVDKFLGWKLPSDFYPDCGISFEQYSNPDNDKYKALREPIGTNLFTATQAKEMFEQCLVYDNDFNLEYTCKRIRRLLNVMGMSDPSNGKDDVLMGCLFSLLGTICNKLEQSKPAKG